MWSRKKAHFVRATKTTLTHFHALWCSIQSVCVCVWGGEVWTDVCARTEFVSLWVLPDFLYVCVSGCVCVWCVCVCVPLSLSVSLCLCRVHYRTQSTGQCQRRAPSGHAAWQRREPSCCQKAFLTHCCSPIGDISGAFDCGSAKER